MWPILPCTYNLYIYDRRERRALPHQHQLLVVNIFCTLSAAAAFVGERPRRAHVQVLFDVRFSFLTT